MGAIQIALSSRHPQSLTQIALGTAYFALAKGGLTLAIIHPSASAVWPASGLALAAIVLWGQRVWPAIFAGAFLANVTTSGAILPSMAIAAGNTLECLLGGYLLFRISGGTRTFESPAGIMKFALICALGSTPISAAVGVGTLLYSGTASTDAAASLWLTWWLGNLAGALLVAPAVILWVRHPARSNELPFLAQLFAITILVGVIAFGPILGASNNRGLFAFVGLVPLLWTALNRGQRDTATVAILLSGCVVWGTLAPAGSVSVDILNDAVLTTLVFLVSASLPSLALSAEASVRRDAEDRLRKARDELETTVEHRTAELVQSNADLRKVAEDMKTLEATNEQHRIQLVEAQRLANLGSWTWDVKTGKVSWSPQLFEIYGVSPAEFGSSIDDFLRRVHPDDRDPVQETITTAYRSGVGFRSRERIVRPNGDVRYLESCGEIVKDKDGNTTEMLGICQDVTAQRHADAALRESEASVRRLVNGIRDYAIFMLNPDGLIVSWNAGAARINQYRRDEVLGRHVNIFYTPEENARGQAEQALQTAARDGRYEGEGWRVRQNGERFWANVVVDAIHDSNGKLIGFGKITRDVTEKREAQLTLEHTRDQLAQAQKMETIGQVTGGVAHDFNNLLSAILSSLRLLEKKLPADSQSSQLLDNALNAAERGASLTQRLLTFARRQDLKPEIVDIPKLITGMTDLLERSIGPSVVIQTRTSSSNTTALVDPTQLELAIFNLVLNARDAMPDGGSLDIEIAHERIAGGKTQGDLPPGCYVRLTVRDTGSGMDEATLRRAVEPFFTTKGIGKGTGLGLSMVQGLAAQSGGAMKIESKSGSGTTVRMWLPASGQSTERKPLEVAEVAKVSRGCRVLVVDDDPLVTMGTVAMLQDLGHATIEAASGRQALRVLQSDSADIDVVITDHAMPGMTGTELIRKIREQHPDLPIILATGWAELPENSVPDFLRLSKPYRQEDLSAAISRVLDRPE